MLQISRRNTFLDAQDFHAHGLITVVVVEHDPRLDFLGFDDLGIAEPQVHAIGFLVPDALSPSASPVSDSCP